MSVVRGTAVAANSASVVQHGVSINMASVSASRLGSCSVQASVGLVHAAHNQSVLV